MENRFGLKDLFLFLLLISLIGIVVLAMVQYDRQWQTMQQTNRMLTEQTTDLSRIRRILESGSIQTGAPNSGQASNAIPPMAGFERILKAHDAPDYAQGGQLVMLSQTTTPKLTPLIAGDLEAETVASYVMDSLLDRDPNTLAYIPRLADSWKISDDSLTIDFTLRHGITFSDGSPFTADDVVYTFQLMADPKVEDPISKVGIDRLDHVEKTGDFSVRFVFKEPYFQSFLTAASTPIMSKAFYSKYSTTDFNRSTGLLIGSGPYRMPDPSSWKPQPGQPIILVRNERYWGPPASFDRMVWNVIEEPSARITAFRNGDIDFLGGTSGPPTPEQYDKLIADPTITAKTSHWALDTPVEGYLYLGWNEIKNGKPGPFADARVRKAMTMLTDRDAIVKTIVHGYGTVLSGPFRPSVPQCDPTIKPLPFDPAAAVQLLADAGFHKVGDRLVGPDGQPLSFKLMFNSNSEQRRRIASFLHDAFAKVGIDAQPEAAEWSIFLKRLDDRQYDVVIGAWGGSIEDDAYECFHSKQIEGTGENFIHFSNPQVDDAIMKARSTVDDAKRIPLWHEVHRLLAEQQPYTFLYTTQELDFMNNRLHGGQPTKVLGLNTPPEWYMPKSMQMSN